MQATLVSHYGHKSGKLAWLLKCIQAELLSLLSTAFTPYSLEQIHATIIGLEGWRTNGKIENLNYRNSGQLNRFVDPCELLNFLRSPGIPSFDVQIGGYNESINYQFLSQGIHPYFRTFSIQGSIAVAMGWPYDRSGILDYIRRSFNQVHVLHKWHTADSDVDNDFFFVLGRMNLKLITGDDIVRAEQSMRKYMANLNPVTIEVSRSTINLVCYENTQLPPCTSRVYAIDDINLTAENLLQCYDIH